jgi:phosphate transport system protein
MPRKGYQEQLDALSEDVLYMSELVLERLRMGLDALEGKDAALGEEVLERDHEINELYLELEQDCIDLFALQQPVAGDLRFIASSFKVITDLERIADLATNLGERAMTADRDVFPEVDVQAIGDETIDMVEAAMDAYAAADAEACFEIADRDDDIDERCREASETVVRELIQREMTEFDAEDREAERLLQDVSRVLLTVRDLERVGDHAVNIAARTLYMGENDDELIY